MGRRAAAPTLLLAALVLLLRAAPAGAGREIEYLYMDGSEGGGSGGHAAIALGDRVFHFGGDRPGGLCGLRHRGAAVVSQGAALPERENPVWVFLRESNTLTSTLYRKAADDSAFLFFTDNAPAARPVFGTLNVITGLGAAAAGLAMLPVDRGELLTSGLKGAFFSLPELVFFNIRKGSFPDFDRRPVEAPPALRGPVVSEKPG